MRALEQQGADEARRQLTETVKLLLGVGLPGSVGLALASNVSSVFLGTDFAADAARIMPVIAIGIAASGLKAFYFDLSFQLGRRTIVQVWITLAAATINVLLNLWWIPRFELIGAASRASRLTASA